jgi:hypothetical protein
MFGNKKIMKEIGNDPQKALDHAEKTINTGFTGFVTKAFMGKDFVNTTNDMLAQGQNAIDMQKSAQNVAQTGTPATAEVINVTDTGQMVNYDPVVVLQIKVTPETEPPFETYAQIIAPKIAVPRTGDRINIRYNPANKSQIAIV